MSSDFKPGRHNVQDYFRVGSDSGSIITATGSTRFGDSADDIHQFSGSIIISGSGGILTLDGSAISGSGGTNNHSALINLNADDHKQYLLVDGTRGMSANLGVTGSINVGGTVGITGSLFVAGTDISSSINSHVTNTSNPHSVAAAQVGNSVAQWNANQLQGNAVTGAAPVDGNMLYWNSGSSTWDLVASSSLTGSGVTAHSALTGLTGSDDHTQYLLVDGTRGMSANLGVTGSINVGGTVGITGSLFVAGTDISSSINSHVTNTSNPHSVTAAQVGNSVAQWNANQLQGNAITGAAPVDGNLLYWNSGSSTWDLVASSSIAPDFDMDHLFRFSVLSEGQFNNDGYGHVHRASLLHMSIVSGKTITFKSTSKPGGLTYTFVDTYELETTDQKIFYGAKMSWIADRINNDSTNDIVALFPVNKFYFIGTDGDQYDGFSLIMVEKKYGDGLRVFGNLNANASTGVIDYNGGNYDENLTLTALPSSDPGDIQMGRGFNADTATQEELSTPYRYRSLSTDSEFVFFPDDWAYVISRMNRETALPGYDVEYFLDGMPGEAILPILIPEQLQVQEGNRCRIAEALICKFGTAGSPPAVGDKIAFAVGTASREYTVVANQGLEIAETDVSREAGDPVDFETRLALRVNADSGKVCKARSFEDTGSNSYAFGEFFEDHCIIFYVPDTTTDNQLNCRVWMSVNTYRTTQEYFKFYFGPIRDEGIYRILPYSDELGKVGYFSRSVFPIEDRSAHQWGIGYNTWVQGDGSRKDKRRILCRENSKKYYGENDGSAWIAEVGNSVAQWNANQLQGNAVTGAAPVDGNMLYWDSGNSTWNLVASSSLTGSGGGVTAHSALTGLTGSDDHTQYLLVDGTRGMSANLGVTGSINVGGTVGITGSLFVAGTNISSSINSHVTNTSNPHTVTAAQVGNSVAQWNANQLQGNAVTGAAPVDGNVFYWDSANSTWNLVASSSIAAGGVSHSALTGLTGSDDHTQYLLVDGTRGMSSDLGISGSITIASSSQFGKLTTDNHQFTGSVQVTGAVKINSDNNVVPLTLQTQYSAALGTISGAFLSNISASNSAHHSLYSPEIKFGSNAYSADSGSLASYFRVYQQAVGDRASPYPKLLMEGYCPFDNAWGSALELYRLPGIGYPSSTADTTLWIGRGTAHTNLYLGDYAGANIAIQTRITPTYYGLGESNCITSRGAVTVTPLCIDVKFLDDSATSRQVILITPSDSSSFYRARALSIGRGWNYSYVEWFGFAHNGNFKLNGRDDGQMLEQLSITALITVNTSSETDTGLDIPAYANITGLTSLVKANISGSDKYHIGWGTGTAATASFVSSSFDGLTAPTGAIGSFVSIIDSTNFGARATNRRLLITTVDTTGAPIVPVNTGSIRLTLHYTIATAPIS